MSGEDDTAETHAAMAALYRSPELRGFIFARLRNQADADDVLHETIARVLRRIKSHGIVAPLGYAIRIAQNLMRDLHRKKLSFVDDVCGETASDHPLQDEQLDQRRRMAAFMRALDDMPPLRRKVFLMRRLDGLGHDVIGERLGLSSSAVEKHVTRALSELRDALAREVPCP